MGKTKLWRLSSIGRKRLNVTRPPLPFNSQKIEHVLGLGSCFQVLSESGRLDYFKYEPKDNFYTSGLEKVYAPDAVFHLKGRGMYILEYQRSPLSSDRWAAKWAVAESFFSSGAYKKASWQPKNACVKPSIIVVSSQHEETIKSGTLLDLTIVKTLKIV